MDDVNINKEEINREEITLFDDDYSQDVKNEYPKLIQELEQELLSLKEEFKRKRQRYARYLAKKNMIDTMIAKGYKDLYHEEFYRIFKDKTTEFNNDKTDFIHKYNYLEECITILNEF